jgi:multidrug efflux pump subunit AcrA (membrane-fusion protein)
MNKISRLLIAIAVLFAGAFTPLKASSDARQMQALYRQEPAEKRRTAQDPNVVGSGEVRPNRYIKLRRELPFRIKKIYVVPGDVVVKGQALAVVETEGNDPKTITEHAPITAIVADIPTRVGDRIAGNSDPPLMTLADMSRIFVEIRLDGADVSRVRAGQRARIIVDAFSNARIRGVVVRKNPQPAGERDEAEFKITLEMTQLSRATRARVRPGMSATAWIYRLTRK